MAIEIANTISTQIGRQAFFMMGAKNLVGHESALSFKVGRNSKGVTHVMVTLTADDLYTVEFIKINMHPRAKEMRKVLATVEGIYVDQLHTTIEGGTGLYLSL